MPHNDLIGRMTDEVMLHIRERRVSFNRAVSWTLHNHDIYHCRERARYNFYFQAIHKRYRNRDREGLKNSLQGPRPWQHGKIIRQKVQKEKDGPLRTKTWRTRLKPGIEVETYEDPFELAPKQLDFTFSAGDS